MTREVVGWVLNEDFFRTPSASLREEAVRTAGAVRIAEVPWGVNKRYRDAMQTRILDLKGMSGLPNTKHPPPARSLPRHTVRQLSISNAMRLG